MVLAWSNAQCTIGTREHSTASGKCGGVHCNHVKHTTFCRRDNNFFVFVRSFPFFLLIICRSHMCHASPHSVLHVVLLAPCKSTLCASCRLPYAMQAHIVCFMSTQFRNASPHDVLHVTPPCAMQAHIVCFVLLPGDNENLDHTTVRAKLAFFSSVRPLGAPQQQFVELILLHQEGGQRPIPAWRVNNKNLSNEMK